MTTPEAYEKLDLSDVQWPLVGWLGKQAGMAELLAPDVMASMPEMLADCDMLIDAYNTTPATDDYTAAPHTMTTKAWAPTLPTLYETLQSDDPATFTTYLDTLGTMRKLMRRAEAGEPEPMLGFAALWKDATPEQRLLGGVIQGYGLFVSHLHAQERGLSSDTPDFHARKDHLLDALVEMSVLERAVKVDTLLFDLSRNQGWFNAQYEDTKSFVFSRPIRNLATS